MAVFFDGMDVNIYGAVMPHMLDDPQLGLTPATAGTIGSWTTFGMLIGALTAGNLTDWLGRRTAVISRLSGRPSQASANSRTEDGPPRSSSPTVRLWRLASHPGRGLIGCASPAWWWR